ncbi:MAG: hypothetical protein DUD39_18400 [Coriobacteriaceae bacterium]|nr:MAG: hypothetical protein DUD39_18400 [Coriobacteriaceae bacterium]
MQPTPSVAGSMRQRCRASGKALYVHAAWLAKKNQQTIEAAIEMGMTARDTAPRLSKVRICGLMAVLLFCKGWGLIRQASELLWKRCPLSLGSH